MKTILTTVLVFFALSACAQDYHFPNVDQIEATKIKTTIDTLFAEMSKGHIRPDLISGKKRELTREMLENQKSRQGDSVKREIINCYLLATQMYRVTVACSKAGMLQQMLVLDVDLQQEKPKIAFPIWYDTRNWSSMQVGTIHYYYDHDFDLKAAQDFDKANRTIATKLGLQPEPLDFYLSDNFQQIMQWMGSFYDCTTVGQIHDGFGVGEQTIFATQHNEDFSHDLVHYYVYKVRKGPRNPFAEEGVAYYWGNAYYPDAQGKMIGLELLKDDLRNYLAANPGVDLLIPFRKNQRGVFCPAREISMRSTLSGIIAEYVEKKHGIDGVLKLLNCGAGEENYFAATQLLAGINAANFNQRIRELLP